MPQPIDRLTIVGLGLLGGSIALAARQMGLARQITAVGRDLSRLQMAHSKGLVDTVTTDAHAGVASADLVVLCQPVDVIADTLPGFLRTTREGALITDVGSTKSVIVQKAEADRRGGRFVGSHPMAGSDRTGWEHARADLFRGATTYITVTEKTDLGAACRVAAFWGALGSRQVFIHPRRHDRYAALLSHLPHMAAVELVNQLTANALDPVMVRLLCGPGLRDTTRVAKGSPDLWQQICLQNGEELAQALESFGDGTRRLAAKLRAQKGEEVLEALGKAQRTREAIDEEGAE